MTDTPKKTLTLKRKTSTTGKQPGTVARSGKRIIRRDELPRARPAKASAKKPAANRKKKPARVSKPKMAVSPSDLKARELNDRLNAFPVWLNYQPLAIGVDKEIFRLVNDECFPGASKKVVQKVLRMHTGHGRYLQALVAGGERFRLDGVTSGIITGDQQEMAARQIIKRGQVN